MNTIIASKKKAKQLEEKKEKKSNCTSINKKNKDSIIISLSKENNIDIDDIINNNKKSSEDISNSHDKCTKCSKYEKEIESLVFYKSEMEKKYREEKLKNKLLEKRYKTDTTISNELNSTISTLRQDLLKKDVEIKHLQAKALEYKTKYNQTMSNFEEDKNNFIETEKLKQNIKNKEINYKINNTNNQLISYAKENTELKSQMINFTEEKRKLNEEINKLKKENENLNNMLTKTNKINNELNCTKNMLYTDIEAYKRELSIIKENLDKKIKENEDNCKKNEFLRQDSSKNLFIAVNKQQELIETEINFEKLKNENLKLKGIIDNLNNDIIYMKNAKNVNDLLLSKQINENKILSQENNELKQRILYMEKEYKKIENMPKKDSILENELIKKNNILSNENINHLEEINKLITQNEFLKNYYFNHENKITNKNKNKINNDISVDSPKSKEKIKEKNGNIDNLNNELNNNLTNREKENYLKEIQEYMKQKILLEEQVDKYKNIINKLNMEKDMLTQKLLNKNLNVNELMLRIQEMENEEINNRKELIKKNIENTDLKEQNIQCLALQDKLNKTIDRKNKLTKGSIIANNSLKKLNDDNQRQIIDLNSEIYILEKKYKDKEEYIKELNEENIKQKNEILRLKKDNETLYKIIHNKK